MLNFCDFIQVYVFTTNHHLNLFDSNLNVFQPYTCSTNFRGFEIFRHLAEILSLKEKK